MSAASGILTKPVVEVESTRSVKGPQAPTSLKDTGLSEELLIQLLVKTLVSTGELTEASGGAHLKLPYSVMKELFTILQRDKLCAVRGHGEPLGVLYRYTLTDEGRNRAQAYFEISRYVGPAPVPLAQYAEMINRQPISRLKINRAIVEQATAHLILPEKTVEQIGEAINSGWPIFLYGPPGNGKTVIAEAIGQMLKMVGGGEIYIPYAVEVDGQIIQVFDPISHQSSGAPVEVSNSFIETKIECDPRWELCRRPVEFAGGELTMGMLDLSFNPIAKYYKAPPHIKANGGVFLIDDFGRQLVRPRDLLNRWIVPLEKRVDYLTLHSGKVFQIPFDTIVIFATNLEPQKLADEAFLRRIRNKVYIADPTRQQYAYIFQKICESKGVPFVPEAVEYLFENIYDKYHLNMRSCHPRDLIEQVVSIAKFKDVPPTLDKTLLDRACHTYFFVEEEQGEADAGEY
ncbi:MAG: AAA family ATPase [Nitrospirales bacterium]|nr:AAA family ATPase [Nitrospira sp.]MDR4500044.1 AAA family ATPase [Nitrospirales bacterium]